MGTQDPGPRTLNRLDRILIVRLGSLGDLVHALPAVAAIRRAHPDAEIDWLVDVIHRDFLDLVSVITRSIALEGRGMADWRRAIRTLRAEKYGAAIDFQGLLKSAALARFSGARRVIGFDTHALRERTAAPFYTERVVVGEGRHVIEKNLRLAAALGAVPAPALEFPLTDAPSRAVEELTRQGVTRFALLNPGAAWPNKRWPPASFGALARHIKDAHGLDSVVLWGPSEREIAEAVVAASGGAARVAPETAIADLVALSRRAALFVSGDTGPLHIASAAGAPTVSLFGPTSPERNGPWKAEDISISRYSACECHYKRVCSASGWCLASIRVADAVSAVNTRLQPKS